MLAHYKKRYSVTKSCLLIHYNFNGTIKDIEKEHMMKKITSIDFEVFDIHSRCSMINEQLFLGKNLQFLSLSYTFNKQLKLNKKLRYLIFNGVFNQELILSKNILIVKFNFTMPTTGFNRPIVLNKRIIELFLGDTFVQPILLTKNLKRLFLGRWYWQKLHIETQLNSLNMYSNVSVLMYNNLPNSISEIYIDSHLFCPHKCIFTKKSKSLKTNTGCSEKLIVPKKWIWM